MTHSAALYFGILMKEADPAHEITILERKKVPKAPKVRPAPTTDEGRSMILKACPNPDILINNAGIFQDAGVSASQGALEQWRATFETNVFNLVSLTQKLLPLVKKSEAGRIVNLTSILGSLTLHSTPNSPIASVASSGAAYNASKAAVNMFTVNLANELKNTPIKVNAAHPGWVKTDMGGEEAPLEVAEGAKTSVALALLSEGGPTGGYFHLGQTLPW